MTKKVSTPAIRFKGFTDTWEQRKLTDFVDFYAGLTYTPSGVQETGTLVLRSSNVSNGEIVDADNVYVCPEVVNVENVQVGDIVVVVRNGSRSLIGKHAQIKRFMPNTVIGAFITGIRSECPEFTNALLNTPNFDEEISLNMGATINQITGYMFSKMEFHIPNLDEQNKIGEFFENLDHLITLHQRKYDKLTNVKKSMLEKMFPKNGSNVPEIRFKGFTDAWKQRKLGDIADIVGGGTPSTENQSYWNGDIDWYAPAEIADQIYANSSQKKITGLGYENSSAKMLPPGTVLFTSRAGIGKTAILTRKGCTNQGFQSIVPHRGELDSYFIFSRTEELKRYGELVGAGSTFVEVSGKQMAVMELMMPPTMREQQTIGGFFQQLDNLITLHQRKLEKLKNLKKACLEKMFV
jgi:putative type I S-subunit protein